MQNAIVVSLSQVYSEFRELLEMMNYQIVYEFIQKRAYPDPHFFVGRGKLTEIADFVRKNRFMGVLFFNGTLTPTQFYNAESTVKLPAKDRIMLILEVFEKRAHSVEARLQVRLGRLKYEIPHIRNWIHQAKMGEHPGFLAGGEYKVDQYYAHIKRQEKIIEQKLEMIRREREHRRFERKKRNRFVVGLAGYTNAGKSTIMKQLTKSNPLIDNHPFTTLSTTIRRLGNKSSYILVADTIGFIEDLPPWLIEAFKSTLEELYHADVILLIIDGCDSENEIFRKLKTCYNILMNNHVVPAIILVLNKIDKLNSEELHTKLKLLSSHEPQRLIIPVSGLTGEGIEKIVSVITEIFTHKMLSSSGNIGVGQSTLTI